jgi:V8-like Glu-specific endopeptidase
MIAKYVKHIKVDGNEKDIALLVFDNSSKNKYHSYCQKNGRPILQIPKYKPTILTREDVGQVAKVIGYHGDTQNDVCGATGKLVYDDGIWKHMISTEHGCSGAGVTRNDKMYGVHTKGKDAEDRNGFEAFTKEILLEIEQGMRDLNC